MPLHKPRKKPEPRPIIRRNDDVKKAGVGWHKVSSYPGLYLVVDAPNKRHPNGLKRWMFRYKRPGNGRPTEISIGHWPHIDLHEARMTVLRHSHGLARGKDPQEVKQSKITFAEAVEKFIERYSPHKGESWLRNAKNLLNNHSKRLARERVASITSNMVEKIILALAPESPTQARRTLDMLKQVFDFTQSQGWRSGDNPARWKELHKHNFPGLHGIPRKNHPALDYWQMPEFMQSLRPHQAHGVGAIALEMTILTILRPNKEALLMQWDEIDWDQKLLTIPAERMKTRVTHRVPLSDRAIILLKHRLNCRNGSPYVFTGYSEAPLAEKTMILLLRNTLNISKEEADIHGFRRTFRSWCAVKKFDYAASEMCLAHTVGTPVAQAYWGTDLLDERRLILNTWASYIG